MKIVHVVDSMQIGGAETLVFQMCRVQRNLGHEPCVYAVAALGALGEQMRAEGFTVEANIGRHLADSSRKFLQLFKSLRPDVVHLHNPTPTIYAAPAARFAGTPSIVSTRHSLVAPPRSRIMEFKYSIAATFCDWVVGICDATVSNIKEARSAPSRKIVRVYNGALPIALTPKDQCPPRKGFTLVYVGRIEPVKNHSLLLRAFQTALASIPDLQLWMVGDGTERGALERLAKELGIAQQVTFWGQQLDVARFFSAADAFVMSSVSEGLPMSLLQALSLGLPAIVTDIGGMGEVVRLAQAGLTVSVADPAEMAAAIVRIATSPAEREEFSTSGRNAFQQYFTLEAMVDAYMKLYFNTARARRASRH